MRIPDRPYLIGSVVGVMVFAIPLYMLIVPRSPVVETTNFHMVPSVVMAGQKIEAVWTDRTLRTKCAGEVYRRFIGSDDVWVLNPVHTVHHADVGDVQTFHTSFTMPNMPAGPAKFRKYIKRWCNPFQEWLWPMLEIQEAAFSVVESAPGPHRP